jgi:hypothetical protein
MTEIHRQEEEGKNWWEGDERFLVASSASSMCAASAATV